MSPRLLAAVALAFCALTQLLGRGMFSNGPDDLFVDQLRAIEGPATFSLYSAHLLRYVTVFPFWFLHTHGLPAFLGFLALFPAIVPVTGLLSGRIHKSLLMGVLCAASLFFSYRTVLAVCGISFLRLLLSHEPPHPRSRLATRSLYVFSGLFSNLSSGVLLAWLGIQLLFHKKMRQTVPVGLLLLVGGGAAFSLSLSLTHKLFVINEPKAVALEQTTPERVKLMLDELESCKRLSPLPTLVCRSTFVSSVLQGRAARATIYGGLFLALLGALLVLVRERRAGSVDFAFLLAAAPLFFVEGLGFAAFSAVLCCFYWNRSLPGR